MASATETPAVISADLVRTLLEAQFPQWSKLHLEPVPGGWDHRTFRLGEDMTVRLPSSNRYAAQVAKEARWLPKLAPHLPIGIPEPLALAKACDRFPFAWAIYRWIDADVIVPGHRGVAQDLAEAVARFLRILHAARLSGGPPPGAHSFGRGGPLAAYDDEVREALILLEGKIEIGRAREIWNQALAHPYSDSAKWLHGDVAPSNLLTRHGKLFAAIDWGLCAAGDPSCDLAFAWTSCDAPARRSFREALQPDDATWTRGQGWALWKSLKILADFPHTDADQRPAAAITLRRLIDA